MSNYVLDASAILAFLNQEKGTERVTEILATGAVISAVNLSEVMTKLIDAGVPEEEINLVISYLNLTVINFDEQSAWYAACLRPLTRNVGLSFGDRACLGLSLQLNLPAVTSDRAWQSLMIGVTIEIIR